MNIQSIITPSQAKAARHAAELSQAKVSAQTGISRTKLALFEVEKYLLEEGTLTQLRDFYESIGVLDQADPTNTENADQDTHVRPGCTLLDGFAIPTGIDEHEVEAVLANVARNDERIDQLSLRQDGKDSWLL